MKLTESRIGSQNSMSTSVKVLVGSNLVITIPGEEYRPSETSIRVSLVI